MSETNQNNLFLEYSERNGEPVVAHNTDSSTTNSNMESFGHNSSAALEYRD